jgi:hypothetical protein
MYSRKRRSLLPRKISSPKKVPCLKSKLLWRPQFERLEDRTVPSVTLGVHVPGVTGAQSTCGCEPPDGAVAAGPVNVVEGVNTAMEIFNKSGGVVSGPTGLNAFFGGHGFTVNTLSDPVVYFDESVVNASGPNGRFVILILDFTSANATDNLDIAISTDSDATHGFTNFRQINVGETSFFADQPRLGINADAYFVQFNMFSTAAGSYDHAQVLTIQKSTFLTGGLTTFHHDFAGGNTVFSVDPANMHEAASGGPEYFVTEDGTTVGNIDVITETNVLSNTPTDTTTVLTGATYSQPPAAPQPGGTITTNDSRMMDAEWRNNVLVAAHTVGTGATVTAHARYYQISTSGSMPTMSQFGEVNPGAGIATYFPSVDINANGTIGMTYMESSSTENVSFYVTGRTSVDPSGTMEPGVAAIAGTAANTAATRAGDYSQVAIDPSDGTTFWAENEYFTGSGFGVWNTGVASFTLAPPNGDHLVVTAPPASQAGSPFTVTVTAERNSDNSVDTNFAGTVHFTFTGSNGGSVPMDYMFMAGDAGVHTFTNGVTLNTAGSQQVTATDTSATPAAPGSATVLVSPGTATQLMFGQQPTDTVIGAHITPAVTVQEFDGFGNLETGDNSTSITMSIGTNPGSGTLSGTNPQTLSGGVATFNDLSINNTGSGYTLVANGGGLPAATSNPFNIVLNQAGNAGAQLYSVNSVIPPSTPVSSTVFTDVTGLTLTITTGSDNVKISGQLGSYNQDTGAYNSMYIRLTMDGNVVGGPYGFTLPPADPILGIPYVENYNFEDEISVTPGMHTFTVQALSTELTAGVPVIFDPGTRQALRLIDYRTFGSFGSDVQVATVNAVEAVPPVFGGTGTPVNNGAFAVVPGLTTTMTTTSTDTVRLEATLSAENESTNFGNLQVRFLIDGTRSTTAQTFWVSPDNFVNPFRTFQFENDLTGLAAGAHTIVVQAGTTSGANVLFYDGGQETAPDGSTVTFQQTMRVTDYRTIPNTTPAGSSGWVPVADVKSVVTGALAGTFTNVPGLTATFTTNGTVMVRLEASLNVFNISTTAFGFPNGRFLIDGTTATVGNSWNVDPVNLSNAAIDEEGAWDDFVTVGPGTHTVVVQAESLAGNVNFEGATSSGQTLRVAVFQIIKTNTSLAVTSSANPSVFGQPVTFTGTVTQLAPGFNPPTGIITFFDGGSSIGTGTIGAGGTATFTTSGLAVGTHMITSSYGRDDHDNGSNSVAIMQTVNKDNVSIAVVSSLNPSVFGQAVTFTATVSAAPPGAGTPTGMVTFLDGGVSFGSASLSGGSGSFTTSGLSAGIHNITVSYSGDANFNGGTSSSLSQTVNQASTSTTVTNAPNPSLFGHPVTFTATVTAVSPGAGTPTGVVVFTEGGSTLGSAPLSGGTGSFSTSSLGLGSHTIVATYSGDANFGSSSVTVTQTVQSADTTTTIASSENPSIYGDIVTFSATVSSAAGTVNTGTVAFLDGSSTLASVPVSGGMASFSTGGLTAGSHVITASYSDGSSFNPSGASLSQTVNQKALLITANDAMKNEGDTLTFAGTEFTANGLVNGDSVTSVTLMSGGAAANTEDGSYPINASSAVGSGLSNYSITYNPGTLTVHETAILTSSASLPALNEGDAGATLEVGTFTHANGVEPATDFSATVDWGIDGHHADPATVTQDGSGTYHVAATQPTFSEEGFYGVTVSISDDSASAAISDTQEVDEPAINASSMTLPALDEGGASGGTQRPEIVASFTHANGVEDPSVFTATVDWGIAGHHADAGFVFGGGGGGYFVSAVRPVFTEDGTYTVTVTISEDNGSVSVTDSQLVNEPPLNGFSATLAPIHFGDPSVTVEVTTFTHANAVEPAGDFSATVDWGIDGHHADPGFVSQDSMGTYHVSSTRPVFNTPGTYTVTVTISEDNVSTMVTDSQVVNNGPVSTTTTLSSSANPSVFGQSVTFTAIVTPNSGSGTPTGMVTFTDGSATLGSGTLSGGQASLATSSLAVGQHTIVATYAGDGNFTGSTSNSITQTVNQDGSTTTVTGIPNPSNTGQTITFTITVAANAPGSGTPTGTVKIILPKSTLGTFTLSNGQATFMLSNLPNGTTTIRGQYSGDSNFTASTTAMTQTVNGKAVSTIRISSSHNPTAFGNSVTFTAVVSGPGNTPTGTVTFIDSKISIGSATLNSSGVATFTTSSLSIGSHNIFAQYAGNAQYNSSSSNVVTQTVTASTSGTVVASQAAAQPTAPVNPAPLSLVVTVPMAPAAGRSSRLITTAATSGRSIRDRLAMPGVYSTPGSTTVASALRSRDSARGLDLAALDRFFSEF